jgi:PPE-repeat protein
MTTFISTALQRAQQALSEKYGIPTFDIKGNLSTIPQTRPLTDINVGLGAYAKQGITLEQFNNALRAITPQKATVPTTPTVISGGAIVDIPNTSKLVEGETPLGSRTIPPNWQEQIKPYIPWIVIGGIGLISLKLLKGG